MPLILLVDDSRLALELQLSYLEQAGLGGKSVMHGREAIQFCQQHRPDLIVMDIVMPDISGIETAIELRKLFGEIWVPIIFLTANDQENQVLQGLAAGGDDYLIKPVNPQLLLAKIQAFLRIARMQHQITQDAVRLARYYEENEFEQTLALDLIQRLTYRSFVGQSHIWHKLHPAGIFNGDIICRSLSASSVEHFLLADCTGHGLTAAISALPVIDGFYELVKQYLSTSLLASGINKKLHSLLPTGRFVAAALCSINHIKNTLSVWNGGIPCALLIGQGGELRHAFASRFPPLGILDESDFDPTLEQITWQDGDLLVLASDGITEASTANGEQFGVEGVLRAIKTGWPNTVGQHILDALYHHLEGDNVKDDVSLLIVQL